MVSTARPAAAVKKGLFIIVTCSLQETGQEASSPGPPFRGPWESQEEHAGTQIHLCLSFLHDLMERAQAWGRTDLNLEFGSAMYQLWDTGQISMLLQASICSSTKWAQ